MGSDRPRLESGGDDGRGAGGGKGGGEELPAAAAIWATASAWLRGGEGGRRRRGVGDVDMPRRAILCQVWMYYDLWYYRLGSGRLGINDRSRDMRKWCFGS